MHMHCSLLWGDKPRPKASACPTGSSLSAVPLLAAAHPPHPTSLGSLSCSQGRRTEEGRVPRCLFLPSQCCSTPRPQQRWEDLWLRLCYLLLFRWLKGIRCKHTVVHFEASFEKWSCTSSVSISLCLCCIVIDLSCLESALFQPQTVKGWARRGSTQLLARGGDAWGVLALLLWHKTQWCQVDACLGPGMRWLAAFLLSRLRLVSGELVAGTRQYISLVSWTSLGFQQTGVDEMLFLWVFCGLQ